jgi:hypothetical protein
MRSRREEKREETERERVPVHDKNRNGKEECLSMTKTINLAKFGTFLSGFWGCFT